MGFSIDATSIIVAFIGLLAAAVAMHALPWLKAKAGHARWEQLHAYTQVAVGAAQQMFKAADGEAKLGYATAHVKKMLESHGIKFDADVIRAEIESAVLRIKKEAETDDSA